MGLIHRRSLLTGLVSLIAAPAIVKIGSLMPVKHMWVDTFARDAFGSRLNEYEIPQSLIGLAESYREMRERIYAEIFNTPYREPSLPITTPRQIRT